MRAKEAEVSEKIIDRPELDDLGNYEFGWSDKDDKGLGAKRGISEEVVRRSPASRANQTGCLSVDCYMSSSKKADAKPGVLI